MLRNSFKFLSLVLAVSLTVAPISAIEGTSNSSRFGLGLAVFGLVCIVAYKYFSGKNVSKQEPIAAQRPVNSPIKRENPAGELHAAEKVAGRFTEKKIAVKSKANFDAEKEAEEVKKSVEEPGEKPAIEPEIEPANVNEEQNSEYIPGSYHMVTLANLVLRHVEAGSKENKHFEQPNKITEARNTLKKTETNTIEHKSRTKPTTALGKNSQFARAAERNNKE